MLAGPSVGQFFAELGAEVIKIENLKAGGDVTRTWKSTKEDNTDVSAYFSSVNWGKKSLAVDLSKDEGKVIVRQLCEKADIVIASYKPGDAEKMGVDYWTLSSYNPTLIYGQITGYGDSERVGYDAVIQAESGFMDLNGDKDGDPLKMPVALIDVLAAHHLKEGLLIALLNKQFSGKGELVEVSLIQAAIASLVNQASNYLVANVLPKRQGSMHPNIAPYGENYVTKSGQRVLLAIGSDRQFHQLCRILKLDHLILDARFASNPQRVKNRVELNHYLGDAISKLDARIFIDQCHTLKIPAGIVQNLQEVFEMPEAIEILIKKDGSVGVRNHISKQNGELSNVSHILPPPKFGEHTSQILSEKLSFSALEVDSLRRKGVIQ